MPTRQQRRAKGRAPQKKKRKGSAAFLAAMLVLLVGGALLAAVFRTDRPEVPQRGAIESEHWHAPYSIALCGQPLAPFPFVQGDVHTHGDGQIHIHPTSELSSGENANLGAFFQQVESALGVNEAGNTFLALSNGAIFEDGETPCPDVGEGPQEFTITVNGEPLTGDPAQYVLHEGDTVAIRFGPEPAADAQELPNPLAQQMLESEQQQGGQPQGQPGQQPTGEQPPPGQEPTGEQPPPAQAPEG